MAVVNPVVLQVKDVTKRFNGNRRHGHLALGGVNLFLDHASRVGIVGESGSGKSTLARILVGLERPTDGSVTFGGRELSGLGPSERADFRRSVQLIAQDTSSSFDPRRTLRDAVRRPAQELLGLSSKDADERVDEALSMVDLLPAMADRKPHEVSGGQRQRFAIARALVVKPGLIICDEVVSALDVSVQGVVLNFLKDYCASSQAGLVFVSHGLPATAFIAEEMVVMKDGLIVEQGPTDRVINSSAHPYTAQLVDAYRGPATHSRSTEPVAV
jgi:peptide/nickel transport system ATP-binding protein